MHILHVTPYYAPAYPFGGVVRAVEGMARALVERGHHVTVLTTDALHPGTRAADPHDEMRDGVRVVRVRNLAARGTLNLSTPRRMAAAARPLIAAADVIHCHEFRTVENLIVTPLAARAGKPLLLSPHGTLALETGRGAVKAAWDRLFSPAIARRFSAVIGLTQDEADEARALWSAWSAPALFPVVPNGVNPDEFARLEGASFRTRYGLGDTVVCLFLGRLHPRKGAHLLAEAFQKANVPGSRLVIAGPDEGALPLIQPFADDAVTVTGYLDTDARKAALGAADLFALPAVGEGLSMALLEAMSAGLPVLVTPGCHLPEAAEHGAGIEVERDVDALANALRVLLSNAHQREQMGAAARHLVASRFTWAAVAAQLEAIYTSVC